MPRITIRQFRAALAGRREPGALVRSYRDLARRPQLAATMESRGWMVWEPDAAATATPLIRALPAGIILPHGGPAMTRVSIQQFRAILEGRAEQGTVVRAYRKLARRPGLVAGMLHNEWAIWSDTGAPATSA